jgi:hypothetical protein
MPGGDGGRIARSEAVMSAPSPAQQPSAPDAHSGLAPRADERWGFQWVDAPPSGVSAHVSGLLRWNGIDLPFAADNLRGIDGRLSAPSVQMLSAPLQQLVLAHFAAECLDALAQGPLADLALVSIQWHEQPLPMDDGFEFLVRRPGARGATRGRLSVPDAAGHAQWIDAVASLGWPLPAALAFVRGRLVLGSVCLSIDECAQLDVGDLVWIDDAELSPQGLRVHFEAEATRGQARRAAWMKRSELRIDATAAHAAEAVRMQPPHRDGMRTLTVAHSGVTVTRHWLHLAAPLQRMPLPTSAMTWAACHQGACDGPVAFEGSLVVVARRVGLRIARVLRQEA